MGDRRRPGARLFRIWMAASIVYVAVAGTLSVGPVRTAIAQAAQSEAAPPPRALPAAPNGPVPDAPDTPAVKAAKTVARQAAITFAPPLLALWFGWDVWFAVVGFLSPGGKGRRD